ncbi:MAG: hypothetical protein CL489_06705 [Acidobacteria bacterium]|nr:hypothetical protein [Acidobacteriota bacterium]|tara:strand:+ start:1089 stop:1373 length:285 start_codon:yes stop_codon:yes gene_type:complete
MVSNSERDRSENHLNEWECQVCVEVIDAEDINAAWLLQYDFIVCEKCVIEHNMTVKGKNVQLDLNLEDLTDKLNEIEEGVPSTVRAMADINGEI